MRVVALLATHNESRFIGACIEHLRAQGVAVHVMDNGSTDDTVEIAERYLGDGVVAIEHLPWSGEYDLPALLAHKERRAADIDADWFMHQDPDEFRVSPRPGGTLLDELREADEAGFNAVNFLEFTFVPCAEEPDHDHARFLETMRWYYAMRPYFPNQVKAWKRQDAPVDLVSSGGHLVGFAGRRLAPRSLNLRHYLCLSRAHAVEKYCERRYAAAAVARGFHYWRSRLRPEHFAFPPAEELREYRGDHWLDPTEPRTRHFFADRLAAEAL